MELSLLVVSLIRQDLLGLVGVLVTRESLKCPNLGVRPFCRRMFC
jgi:hypothetical protein